MKTVPRLVLDSDFDSELSRLLNDLVIAHNKDVNFYKIDKKLFISYIRNELFKAYKLGLKAGAGSSS